MHGMVRRHTTRNEPFRMVRTTVLAVLPLLLLAVPAWAQKWATSWAAADQGPYPAGNALNQPDMRFAFPAPTFPAPTSPASTSPGTDADGSTPGARDQSFRLAVPPALWGRTVRIRLSNAFGQKPVTFDGAFIGLQSSGANVMPGSNRPVTFDRGKKAATVPPGQLLWSDPVTLPFVSNPAAPELAGRRLLVSFHVSGPGNTATGPMTWHAASLNTSYLTAPGAGALGEIEDDSAFPNSTTSTFFLDALDVQAPADTKVVVALGDGTVDGAGSTPGGADRWTDVLNRRLAAAGMHVVVVDAGIAGNQVLAPANPAAPPAPGGPAAATRLDRDVLSLSGVTHVIWLGGGNDLSALGHATPDAVMAGFASGVGRLRARSPGLRVLGGTVISTAGSTAPTHAVPGVEQARQTLNAAIRGNGTPFDGVIDFDAATTDRTTGQIRAEFKAFPGAAAPSDGVLPNRAGYIAMADAVDLKLFLPPARPAPRRPAPRPAPSPAPSPSPAEAAQ